MTHQLRTSIKLWIGGLLRINTNHSNHAAGGALGAVLAILVIHYGMGVTDSPTERAGQHATIGRLLSAARVWGLDGSV